MSDNKVHQRILSIAVTVNEGADTALITGVTFYRDRQSLDASQGYAVTNTPAAAGATTEVVLGEVLPPPSVIQLVTTGWA